MKVRAYAKVNLYLDVTQKRNDGFHNILTLFKTVPYYDELDMEFFEKEVFTCNKKLDFQWEDNLIKKSIELFKKETGYDFNLKIHLNKNLPTGGGIGGGSADSAAIFRFLGKNFNIDTKDLILMGEKIGSDVPFLIKGGTAIAEGKGEKLTFLEDLMLKIKLYPQNIQVSTPKMYYEIDKNWNNLIKKGDPYKLYEAFKNNDYFKIKENLFNVFEQVVYKEYPELLLKKKRITKESENELVLMSGSGSTIFEVWR